MKRECLDIDRKPEGSRPKEMSEFRKIPGSEWGDWGIYRTSSVPGRIVHPCTCGFGACFHATTAGLGDILEQKQVF